MKDSTQQTDQKGKQLRKLTEGELIHSPLTEEEKAAAKCPTPLMRAYEKALRERDFDLAEELWRYHQIGQTEMPVTEVSKNTSTSATSLPKAQKS